MRKLSGLVIMMFVLNSCMVVHTGPKHAPPGQVKKVTGSQSAKPYAPGQKKKH